MRSKYTVMNDKPKEYFHLIPQTGVTHMMCLDDPKHNAIWDMAISPEGRVFFSVCGESYEALYARLYEYDHKSKKFIRHMALEDKILMSPHSLRTSKFHTAISFPGGGKILTTTHTTSPAPTHPTWMPYQYADHPFESYPGSNLLIYDYNSGECRGLGTISPHDTTYGATYDPKNGDYFAITWMRGTGYVYNVHTGDLRCLGQISDTHTSRTFLLSDGHIYGSTYSGAMFRYNTDIRDVEFLGVNAPGLIRHAVEVDGVMYFTTGPCSVPGRGQELYAYDLKAREITTVGRPVPKAESIDGDPNVFYNAYGMAFDSKKRMWYGCMTFVPNHKYVGTRLYMWDFLGGKEPVDCGFLGSLERTVSITAEMYIVDDILYISDGNHTSDRDTPAGIVAIELDKFVPALESEERIFSHDYVNYIPYQLEAREWYPRDDMAECMERYDRYYEDTVLYYNKFLTENSPYASYGKSTAVSVWEKVGRGKAGVKKIEWTSDTDFSFIVGDGEQYRVDCTLDENGKARTEALNKVARKDISHLLAPVPEVDLPAVQGRKYLARAESSVELADGSILVGTGDTMLAVVRNGRVFSLGQVCSAGGVHSLTALPDGTAYGVAGHSLGTGQIFKYSPEGGVTSMGMVPEVFSECGRCVGIYRPAAIAVSPNGKYLAIGGADEMSGVVVLELI